MLNPPPVNSPVDEIAGQNAQQQKNGQQPSAMQPNGKPARLFGTSLTSVWMQWFGAVYTFLTITIPATYATLAGFHTAPSKTTPVDADEIVILDSASSFSLARLTWANLKTTLSVLTSTWAISTTGNATTATNSTTQTTSPPDNSIKIATTAFVTTLVVNAQTFPFRNRLINGDMSVSQINGTAAVTPTTTDTYPIDQWKVDATQVSKLTFQQVADAPAGFKYSIKISVASQYSPLATDRFGIYQPIEGINLIDLQLGLAGAKTIATSLWIKGSVAGTYAVGVNNAGTRSYIGTITVATSWAQAVITLLGDTTGTWATDSTVGAQFYIDLGSGSNFNSTAGAWQAGDFTRTSGAITFVNQTAGATLNITGAQLEVVPTGATQGTVFEFLPYETQLRRCQRYLPCFSSLSASQIIEFGYSTSATQSNFVVPFPVQARVIPTGVVISNTAHFNVLNGAGFSGAATSVLYLGATPTVGAIYIITTAGSPTLTVGQGSQLYFNNAAGQFYFTGAQL